MKNFIIEIIKDIKKGFKYLAVPIYRKFNKNLWSNKVLIEADEYFKNLPTLVYGLIQFETSTHSDWEAVEFEKLSKELNLACNIYWYYSTNEIKITIYGGKTNRKRIENYLLSKDPIRFKKIILSFKEINPCGR